MAELIKIKAIAEMAGVTTRTVYNWRRRYPSFPKPVLRVGKTLRYNRAEVVHFFMTGDFI